MMTMHDHPRTIGYCLMVVVRTRLSYERNEDCWEDLDRDAYRTLLDVEAQLRDVADAMEDRDDDG